MKLGLEWVLYENLIIAVARDNICICSAPDDRNYSANNASSVRFDCSVKICVYLLVEERDEAVMTKEMRPFRSYQSSSFRPSSSFFSLFGFSA